MFYYLNGRLPFTNGLIIVPDGEVPEGMEKINLKNLYSMFKNTKSHGVVSLHFLWSLGIFFRLQPSITKYTLIEFYQNLPYETLSGTRTTNLKVSHLIGELSFSIKQSAIANIKRKEKEDEKSIQEIEKTHNFIETPDEFTEELIDNYLKTLNLHPYVELTVQDAETIEKVTEKENDKLLDLYKKVNEVNDAATQRKKDNEIVDLVDDIKDEDNPFNNIFKTDPEGIFIDDNLFGDFDQNDKKDIKMVSDDILQDKNLNQNDVLFQELPTHLARHQIIKPNEKLELGTNKIKKKYARHRNRENP